MNKDLYKRIYNDLIKHENKKAAEEDRKYHKYDGHRALGIKAPVLDKLLKKYKSEIAELYRAVRPQYPGDLFKALVENTKLQDGAKLLEIGPGTGQATVRLAKRGYDITAIELGADLAEVARKHLAKFNNVKVVTGAFEEVELPPQSLDLVYAATAFVRSKLATGQAKMRDK